MTPNTVNQNELKFHLQVPHRSYILLDLFHSVVFKNEFFKHAGMFESVMLTRSAFSASHQPHFSKNKNLEL